MAGEGKVLLMSKGSLDLLPAGWCDTNHVPLTAMAALPGMTWILKPFEKIVEDLNWHYYVDMGHFPAAPPPEPVGYFSIL